MKISKNKPPKAHNSKKLRKTRGVTKLIKSQCIVTKSRDKLKNSIGLFTIINFCMWDVGI
jgi:hypothetical protein